MNRELEMKIFRLEKRIVNMNKKIRSLEETRDEMISELYRLKEKRKDEGNLPKV